VNILSKIIKIIHTNFTDRNQKFKIKLSEIIKHWLNYEKFLTINKI